jgi:hypothetical protein
MAKFNIILRDSGGNSKSGYRIQLRKWVSGNTTTVADTNANTIVDNDDGSYITTEDMDPGEYSVYAASTASETTTLVPGYSHVLFGGDVTGIIGIEHGGTGYDNVIEAVTAFGVLPGTDVLAYDEYLDGVGTALAALSPGFGKGMIVYDEVAGEPTLKVLIPTDFCKAIDIEIGVDVQAYSANLTSLSPLGSSARTALGLGDLATLSTATIANGGTNATTAEVARENLGLKIGTNVHEYDENLDLLSGKIDGVPSGVEVLAVSDGAATTLDASDLTTYLGVGTAALEDYTATGEISKMPKFNTDGTIVFPLVTSAIDPAANQDNLGKFFFRTSGDPESGSYGLYYIGRTSTGGPTANYTYEVVTVFEQSWS